MNLNAFAVFLTVVDEMSFTRAAERLYISQQALSGYIKRLESYYGVTFFQRKPVLKLTAEGEAMAACARQLLESENSLTRRLADITQNATAVLTLGISYQRSGVFSPGIWNQFHSVHPNISVRLHEQTTDKLLYELQSNRIDVMIGLDISERSNLTIIPLVEERIYCVLSEALLQRVFPDNWRKILEQFASDGIDPTLLRDMPMLLLPDNNRIRSAVNQLFIKHRILPNVSLECSQQAVLLDAACCGSGVAVINPVSIYQKLESEQTMPPRCYSFLLREAPVYTVSLAFRNDIPQPQYVLNMVQCIQEEFRYYKDSIERQAL